MADANQMLADEIAAKYGARSGFSDYAELLTRPDLDGVILATPTPFHRIQAIEALKAGKHVQVEIPLSDSLAGVKEIAALQGSTGLIAMAGHTRRFNPSHRYLHEKISSGELNIQQLHVQTYFLRRSNINALGKPRLWTDHLLWHHAAHTVDLFQFQTGERIVTANAIQGPKDPQLGIAMDMSIQLKSESGKICTLSLSFNNDGPLGSFFRYICDNGTYIARYDELVDGNEKTINLSSRSGSMNGIELQDQEFASAILERREPEASVQRVLPCYEILDELQRKLDY